MSIIDVLFAAITLSLTLWGIWRVNRLQPGDGMLLYIVAPVFSVSAFALFVDTTLLPQHVCTFECGFFKMALTGLLSSGAVYLWWSAWRATYGNRRYPRQRHRKAHG